MATIRRYFYGERPRLAVATVVAVGATTAAILVPFGLLGIGVSGLPGSAAFAVAFGVLPGLAGAICGWYRLGVPATAGSGVAPGVTCYLVVAVGAALDVGSFGGGDSPLGPFALALIAPSFVAAIAGFAVAVAAATRIRV